MTFEELKQECKFMSSDDIALMVCNGEVVDPPEDLRLDAQYYLSAEGWWGAALRRHGLN